MPIAKADLENALGAPTVKALYDDTGTGAVNETALASVLARASAQVASYLAGIYPESDLPTSAQTLVADAELQFAIVYSRDRKPEYWRNAQENERQTRLAEANALCKRIREAVQQIPSASVGRPANVGGLVRSGNPDDPDPRDKFFADGTGDF